MSPSARTTPAPGTPLQVCWRDWSNLQTNLVWIYEGPVSAGNLKGHYNPDHMGAWLVERGAVTLRQKGRTTTARAGEWLVPWPGYRYQEFTEDARILSIRFQAAWPDGKPLFERGLSVKFAASRFQKLDAAARQLFERARPVIPQDPIWLARAPIPFGDFLETKIALLHWLVALYEALCELGLQPSRLGIRDERIVAALQRLDGLPYTEKLVESRLAAEFGLGVSQFVRLFRQELGETPKQYFGQRRRDYARQMLTGSAVPIKEIALNLGFARLSDFSAWFKKHFERAPRLFRQQAMARGEI